MDTTPVVIAARRTPIGSAGHALKGLSLDGLAAPVIATVLGDAGIDGAAVDDVLLGVARGPGGNPARLSALAAGLPDSVPGLTVDRQCGSGLAAVTLAGDLVRSGTAAVVVAGGAESASTAAPGRAAFAPAGLGDPEMGEAAEDLARQCGVSRERQDDYAYRSHHLAVASREAVGPELVEVAGLTADQRPRTIRRDTLARLPAAFADGGTVTAGNSCGVSDGAAAVVMVPEWWRAEQGLPGMALRAHATVGVTPRLPGLGPVPAVHRVLDAQGLTLDDIDIVEITEAFAAQVLAVTDALGLDPLGADASRVCPLGGAIGMGHPWGASGAILVVRLFTELVRRRTAARGLATCAVGGGMGVAALFERVT